MCGLVGQFSFAQQAEDSTALVSCLADLAARRGPDDSGLWTDGRHCTLGFRRLAILDLSPSGHQPMLSPDRRFALVINGEIFNHTNLRNELASKGWQFRSSGDAEVALYALAEWGPAALNRFNGMFALAFYDTLEQKLLLARDHVGSKPLYYLQSEQGLVFASQYDQILAHPWAKQRPVDQGALALYLRFGYIPAPFAAVENTHLLEAGSWLECDPIGTIRQGRYFSFPQFQEPDLKGETAFEAVDAALENAVRRQMFSDVPLGCFLSGGIDSPLISAIAQAQSNQPILAFTIGVEDASLDETADASIYARKIGLEHHLERIKLGNVSELVSDVSAACSEPFGDYSIFPSLLVSQLASQSVKVALSGDGGDELFWGYTGRMGRLTQYAPLFKYPQSLRRLRYQLTSKNREWSTWYFKTLGAWYQSMHEHNFEAHLHQIFPNLAPFPEGYQQYAYRGNTIDETAQWVRWNEFSGHMGDGMLKVDRASMYNGLEVRTPLLDREVIATALRVDWRSCLDIGQNIGKLPLRHALSRRVGHQSTGKRGFSVPMADWLRGPLKPMFQDLLFGRKSILGLEINQAELQLKFQNHCEEKINDEWGLWILLSLTLWEEEHYQKWIR